MDLLRALVLVPLVFGSLACSRSDDGAETDWALVRSPEFVNRVIPGDRPLAIVAVEGDAEARVELVATIDLAGATASVVPASLQPGEAGEVWVSLPPTNTESPFEVTVTGTGDGVDRSIVIGATAIPGSDDLAATATEIVAVFLDELGGAVPGLPSDPAELGTGTPVAGLLVVSHYAWFTDEFEIGLAWHIMVAPDDWAELTMRPRDELQPTRAFRLDSWSTALAGGAATIAEIEPPPEVMR